MSFKIGAATQHPLISAKVKQFLVASVASIGIFGLGNVLGYTSTALPSMDKYYFGNETISTEEKSWVASIAMLGALSSSPVAGVCVDHLGRKNSMLIFTAPFILGWILISYAAELHVLLIGRFLTGFCAGAFSLAVPVYISEISEANIRGALFSLFQAMLVLGILFSYVVGTYLPWNDLAFISAFVPGLALFLLPFVPKTPRYLMRSGKSWQAGRSLHWLRNSQYISQTDLEIELILIEQSIEDSHEKTPKFIDVLKTSALKPIIISLSLMVFRQMSGFHAVIFYTASIFQAAGSPLLLSSNTSSIIVGSVQVIASITSALLVDRIGRRHLLICSQILITISLSLLGVFFFIKDEIPYYVDPVVMQHLEWFPLTCTLTYIVGFNLGVGPLSWTMMGEILPPNDKGACSSISIALAWICAFLVTKNFNTVAASMGFYFCFWVFAGFGFIGCISMYLTVPETKGKSLEDIQKIFKKQEVGHTLSSAHVTPHPNPPASIA